MATAVLVPCGVRLRSDFDKVAPGREKVSDGWIGDTAHQQETSDHNPDETGSVPIHDADKVNEVHAVDVDKDLRQIWLTMEIVVQFLLGRCRSGAEKRLRYIIYNRRIWEASNGWKQRAYTGPNPHDKHAHFSFSYESAREADNSTWHLEEIPTMLTPEDKAWLSAEIDKAATAAAARVWATKITDFADPARPQRQLAASVWTGYSDGRENTVVAAVAAAIDAATGKLLTAIGAISPADVDEAALAREIAAVFPADLAQQTARAVLAAEGAALSQAVGQ